MNRYKPTATKASAKKAVMSGHEGTFLVFRDGVERFVSLHTTTYQGLSGILVVF
jgi:hypothetical protein